MAKNRPSTTTVAERIHRSLDRLTPTERKVATILLGNYPFPGLETVAQLARLGGVSNPTVLRLTAKLGFNGYAEFQSALRDELQARGNSPLSRGEEDGALRAPDADFLAAYARHVAQSVIATFDKTPRTSFDTARALLADPRRPVYLVGGRLTECLAYQMFNHLRLLRPLVRRVLVPGPAVSEDIVDFDRRTLLAVFDIRRYQPAVIDVAQEAKRAGATIILFTDSWLSPISAFADVVLAAEIEVPGSSWDSFAPLGAIIDALVARISEQTWPTTRARLSAIGDIRARLRDEIP